MPNLPNPIKAATEHYPEPVKSVFAQIRTAIFEEAMRLDAGPLEETLKWGEPAYLTPVTKSGSTIRLAWTPATPDSCNLYFNCKTDIVDRFKTDFPDTFQTTSNRCIHIPTCGAVPDLPLRAAVSMALTYHRDKKQR